LAFSTIRCLPPTGCRVTAPPHPTDTPVRADRSALQTKGAMLKPIRGAHAAPSPYCLVPIPQFATSAGVSGLIASAKEPVRTAAKSPGKLCFGKLLSRAIRNPHREKGRGFSNSRGRGARRPPQTAAFVPTCRKAMRSRAFVSFPILIN